MCVMAQVARKSGIHILAYLNLAFLGQTERAFLLYYIYVYCLYILLILFSKCAMEFLVLLFGI